MPRKPILLAIIFFACQEAEAPRRDLKPREISKNSSEFESLLDQAQLAAKAGESVQAQRLLNKARSLSPERAESYRIGGEIYLQAGLGEGALEEWELGLTRAGENAELLFAIGSYYLRDAGDPAQAVVYLKRAEKQNPQLPGLKKALGQTMGLAAQAHWKKGNKELAAAAAARAVEYDPETVEGLRIRAKIAQEQGRTEDALADWEKLIELAPSKEFLYEASMEHKRLGYAMLLKDRRREALEHFRRVVEIGSEEVSIEAILDVLSGEAQKMMEEGVAFFENQEYDEAQERFSYSAALLPENPLAHNHLGLVFLKKGRKQEAAACWERAIEQAAGASFDLGSTPTHKNLILLYKELGETEKAKRIAEDYRANFPQGEYLPQIQQLAPR